jgi:hypothetical protein
MTNTKRLEILEKKIENKKLNLIKVMVSSSVKQLISS